MNEQELYDWILDNLEYRLEKSDMTDNKWCLFVGDYSGRGGRSIPIQYLEDDRIDGLEEEVFGDYEYECEDCDWEEFHEIFQDVFYDLVEENRK